VHLADAVLAVNWLDARSLVETFGLLGILLIIFAETGLLLGFFLPGDSLLFTAGVFAATKADNPVHLSLALVLVAAPVAAIAGAQCGFYIGRQAGPRLFDRPDSRFFQQEYVDRAEHYFNRFGPAKAVMLARFVPIVRTFLNPVAGVLRMPPRQFLVWNVLGGLLWSVGVTLLGYWLGSAVPSIDRYLLPAVFVIIAVSLIPVLLEVLKARREHRTGRAAGATRGPKG
jgi:membrane-associated protein